MSLAQKYRKSLEQRWCFRLKTVHPDGDNRDGVVVDIKREYIVLCDERDFEIDGLQVIPKKVIKGYRDGRAERCWNDILRTNGNISQVRLPKWLAACNKLPEVVAALQNRDIWPGVEILWSDGAESAFYLGPIVRQVDDGFFLRGYAANGTWEEAAHIAYKQVFRIEIDGKYCRHFNSYMKARQSA